jgi:hypothetical protein
MPRFFINGQPASLEAAREHVNHTLYAQGTSPADAYECSFADLASTEAGRDYINEVSGFVVEVQA